MTKLTSNEPGLFKIQILAGFTALLFVSASMAQPMNNNTGTAPNSPKVAKEKKVFHPKNTTPAVDAESPRLTSRPQAVVAMGAGKRTASGPALATRTASQPPRLSMRCNPGKSPNQVGVCQ